MSFTVDQLADGICLRARRIAAAQAELLSWTAEFDRRECWAGPGMPSCAHWLSWRIGLSPSAAREQVRVARRLEELPAVAAAFAGGRLSCSTVRAITRWRRSATASTLHPDRRLTVATADGLPLLHHPAQPGGDPAALARRYVPPGTLPPDACETRVDVGYVVSVVMARLRDEAAGGGHGVRLFPGQSTSALEHRSSMTDAVRVAVLIDCDNISWQLGAAVLAEAAAKGTLGVKRGYGDWSSQALSGWKKQLPLLAVQPMQQPAYVVGKNATDSALIIDAMDLLYSGNVDVFFLVSSDSDFTRLAMRLRESGRRVFGIGAQKTPVAFQNACDRFTFTEVLAKPPGESARSGAAAAAGHGLSASTDDALDAAAVPPLETVLVPAVRAMERDDGWAPLSSVGTYIVNNHPSFDSRNYGSPRLGQLVRGLEVVEVKQVVSGDGSEHPYVRVRPVAPQPG